MKIKLRLLIFMPLCILYSNLVSAQSNDELYAKGVKYREERNYKDGFFVFQKLMKADSSEISYIQNGSYFYSKYGYQQASEAAKQSYYKMGEMLAKKSIKMDAKSAESHYVYAMALGRINENAGSKQKINSSKLIKSEIDLALKLNPKHPGSWHILGRWNRTIAGFNAVEKLAVNALFGGMPVGATYEDAVKSFTQAVVNEPKYKLHQYELAATYYDMGNNAAAKVWANKALALTTASDDDRNSDTQCKALLAKMK